MAVQKIGVRATFDVRAFERGQQRYVAGLTQAIDATRQAADALNALGGGFGQVFSGVGGQARTVVAALNQVATAASAAQGQAGSGTADALRDQLEHAKLLKAEVRDRIALEKASLDINSQSVSALRKRAAAIEQEIVGVQRLQRSQRALDLGVGTAQLEEVRRLQHSLQDLSQKTVDPLQRQLQIHRLIQKEIEDTIAAERALQQATAQTSSELQRRAAVTKLLAIGGQRAERDQVARQVGIPQAELDRIRQTQVTALDLGQKEIDQNQQKAALQRLLAQEIQDTIALKRIELQLTAAATSELQRRLLITQRNTIEANRAARTQTITGLGGTPAQLQAIRQTKVAMSDLNQESKKVASTFKSLSVAGVAMGVALGTAAVAGARALVNAVSQAGRKIIETVTFFDNLRLSVEFFAARTARAEDDTLSFNQALAATTVESQGLLIWLQRLAVASPFTTRDVGLLFRTAQAYGLTSKEAQLLTPLLLDFAAAAGLSTDVLERLALAMGQIRARGKLTGEEVRQLGNAGLPIRDILVKQLGIANDQFDKLLESGALTSSVVLPAITQALKEFEGQGERVAFSTLGGLISAFQEIGEISTSKFFGGAIKPLQEAFKELFDVVNQPQTIAFIQVLGEEMGGAIADGIVRLRTAIAQLTGAWQALDPVVKQQILTFAGAFLAITALAGALGLLFAALTILTSPFVLLTAAFSLLIAKWGEGTRLITRSANALRQAVLSSLLGIARGVAESSKVIAEVAVAFADFFFNLTRDMSEFGFGVIAAFAQGIAAGVPVVGSAIRGMAGLIAFLLRPSSPPRALPDIDQWGKQAGQLYVDAFQDANLAPLRTFGKSTVQEVIKATAAIKPSDIPAGPIQRAYKEGFGSPVTSALKDIRDEVRYQVKAMAEDSQVVAAAGEAGFRVSDAFIQGFLSTFPQAAPRISDELAAVLDKIGAGRQLATGSAFAIKEFLGGLKDADFGALDTIGGAIQSVLSSLVDTGDVSELDLPRILFGSRESVARAVSEIRQFGQATREALNGVRRAAGAAGDFAVDLLQNYTNLASASNILEAAQTRLNAITDRYKTIITPLRRELEAISAVRQLSDEEQQIRSLRRTIANEAVVGARREQAQIQINQILAQRKLRTLEQERDLALEAGEEEVDRATKAQDAAQTEFDLLRARIDAQAEQLKLVGDEASQIRRLEEEADKLRKKQITGLELQLKLLKLQQDEMGDLVKAAKAKYVLDQADSTEMEKQQAILDLQEVALGRQQRLLEVRELGFDESELTKFYDQLVTLDDLGVKTKDSLDFSGQLDDLEGDLPDLAAITAEWNVELEKARQHWVDIKQSILDTATAINENLPRPLRFFAEGDEEDPPIIGTLQTIGLAVAGLVATITTLKAIGYITSLSAAITGVGAATSSASVTGAAAVIRGIGAALSFFIDVGLIVAGLTAVGTAIATVGVLAGEAYVAIQLFREAMNLWQAETQTTVQPGFSPNLAGSGAAMGEQPAEVQAIQRQMRQSLVIDPVDQTEIAKSNAAGYAGAFGPQLQAQQPAIQQSLIDLLANEEILGKAGVAGQDVGAALGSGVQAGLTDPSSLLAQEQTAAEYIQSFLDGMRTAAEIQSPSALFDREIGYPIGLGIPQGVKRAMATLDIGKLTSGIVTAFGTMRVLALKDIDLFAKGMDRKFEALKRSLTGETDKTVLAVTTAYDTMADTVGLRMETLGATLLLRWQTVRTDAGLETTTLRLAVVSNFDILRAKVEEAVTTLRQKVVEQFTLMRTESQAEVDIMRADIVNAIAGEEDSLLSDIKEQFLGIDQTIPKQIGLDWMTGLAAGITSGQQLVAKALVSSLTAALREGANALETAGAAALTASVDAQFTPRPATGVSAASQTFNRTNQYNLTVQSAGQSQGIINDFAILQVMASA